MAASEVFSYETLIREHHLDSFGHVNNATYLELLEEARWELITRRGFGLREIQQKGVGPVILEIQMRFKKELHLRDSIRITTVLEKYTGKIAELVHAIYRPGKSGEELCFTATLMVGLFDLRKRSLILPTPEWKHAIGLTES